MSEMGHSLPTHSAAEPPNVRYAPESGSKIRILASAAIAFAVDGAALHVIQAPTLEPRIMRYELNDFEGPPSNQCCRTSRAAVPRVNDRRVLNGIFWVLRSGAPWRDLPETNQPGLGVKQPVPPQNGDDGGPVP